MENEDRITRRRRLASERQARWRARQSQESIQQINAVRATSQRRRRTGDILSHRRVFDRLTPEHQQVYRESHAESQRRSIQGRTEEQQQIHRQAHAESQRRSIQIRTEEQQQIHRQAHAGSQRRSIHRRSEEQQRIRRQAHAESQRRSIQRRTEEQQQIHRQADAESQRRSIQRRTEEQQQIHRQAQAESQRRSIHRRTEEQQQIHRQAHAESQRRSVQRRTEGQQQIQRRAHAESQRRSMQSMTAGEQQVRRASHAQSEAIHVRRMTPEQRQIYFSSRSESGRRRRRQETAQQRLIRRTNDAERHRSVHRNQSGVLRQLAVNDSQEQVEQHTCGPFNIVCQFCGSFNFKDERPSDGKFTSCCRKGKIKLPKPVDIHGNTLEYPDFLRRWLSNNSDPNYKKFRDNIRSYNSALSFASMGAKLIEFRERGPYIFKVHGQTYHKTSHLLPTNDQDPQFAQLYVIDTTQASDIRMNRPGNSECDRSIMDRIDRFFRQNNRIAQTYQLIREIELAERQRAEQQGETVPAINMVLRRDRQGDQRRYNLPTSNEVAMVFVNTDGEPPFERDIRIYPRNPENPEQPFISLSILSPNMDPMTYSILFPYGEPGWQPNWQCESYEGIRPNSVRKNISMLQYKAAMTAIRNNFNPIMSAGKLTQQWLVDSYLQVEANNLNFIRQNQRKLRAEQYQGLSDHMSNTAGNINIPAGISVILPSSFEGSPRNMRERCCDAMSIFAKYGPPDLFVTFTANPNWSEITENMKSGEHVCDRPDLVARVFKIKLDSLIDDLTKHNIFGESKAFVYSIEFQKRGLPHAHILCTLKEDDKFTTSERIDQFICAEIPSESSARLRETVLKFMIHGPCGINNPNAPCMRDGQCSKKFPKEFNDHTLTNVNGYPLYRRRAYEQAQVRGVSMDSRNVVPYNSYLISKYNAHINVEICGSIKSIKYIYKYIYKGFDCANLVITSEGQQEHRSNEISNFIDGRYVSAPEAIWRLRENKMYDRSHSVIRLPIHLPNQQMVYFEHGNEEAALQEAQSGRTKLESWFVLNQIDHDARQYLYTEIPLHYVYMRSEWKKRQRGSDKIIARMYTVSPRDEERFFLRMLLLHVPGAENFEYLRTVNCTVYETFKGAAIAKGLLESDDEWENCLRDGGTYLMPSQLREMFAYICCFCHPTYPSVLWNNNIVNLALDYLRTDSEDVAQNKALHQINTILNQHGLSCSMIGLPDPIGPIQQEIIVDREQEFREAERLIPMLNAQQLHAFNEIIHSIDNENITNRCFYLDGPGGSGKTFLYQCIISFVRGRGQTALPFATTGIAATLLKGGRTVHSGFKLPIPLLENSVSLMRLTSSQADEIRQSVVIIIDEGSTLEKKALEVIDLVLREICNNQRPFGGKTIVIGGDFRQTLPVVMKGTRTEIVEKCLKLSRLWTYFTKLSLITNMRSTGQNSHNEWLLNVGNGTLPSVVGISVEDIIEIPQQMVEHNDLISAIFGNINQLSLSELARRVIVAPTNIQTLGMNNRIIDMIPGDEKIYYSADSIATGDSNEEYNYPIEFLHTLTPSGMPPHKLILKKGIIIMLLRNLNPKNGLCNGTRLIVEELAENFIQAKILSENNRDKIVFIPRINLAPSDTMLPFILKRRQFPVIPAYAITINKSQGQSFDYVGIDLQTPVFSHGQLYVALSRSRNASNVKIRIQPGSQQGNLLNDERVFTKNVVYKEIL